ncbi:flagellar hook-basal body complex protein [Marinilactibacillus sp. XAAS-LB27]|uniref:flagellar hook-basal body complex protein n=1 Tax=Marinilactibacillus sp. XAAS-LB27 TaxID=3114538 RepID=UPI002E17E2C1|nr:flagellar hook-basal body complex protein [Marinilactibacillus sp. XAAS-LB27]
MIRGIDTLSKNFNVLSEKQKNLATNTANVTTPGFKSQNLVTSTTEAVDVHNYTRGPELNLRRETGQIVFGNQLDEAYRNLDSGALQGTNNQTDVALSGDGYFTVQGPGGETFYTRNGNFSVNDQNQLVTQEGYAVLGIQNGGGTEPITVNDENFTIDQDGFVISGQNAPQFLYITNFQDQSDLTTVGDTLFQGENGVPMGTGFTTMQGYVEQSNVDMVDVMSDMMQISREFEANQKILRTMDETLRRATQEVGKA